MNIIINGSHMEITDAIREYVTKKLQVLNAFVDDTSKVVADIGKTTNHHKHGDIFRAEFHVHAHGDMTRVSKEADNLYTAIDIAQGEMLDALSRKKDKKDRLWRKGAQRIKSFARGLIPKRLRK